MAIDTREKRQACVGIGHYFRGPTVTPNVAKDVEWRQESGWGYPAAVVPLRMLRGVGLSWLLASLLH